MPIPSADCAYIPRGKLAGYLLNAQHPVGGSKANWFLGLVMIRQTQRFSNKIFWGWSVLPMTIPISILPMARSTLCPVK
jgi:hypothetical protein